MNGAGAFHPEDSDEGWFDLRIHKLLLGVRYDRIRGSLFEGWWRGLIEFCTIGDLTGIYRVWDF